jgi:putative Mg2+ transporter-C (MgtC) family protein
METWAEFIGLLPSFFLKISTAALCGGLVGIERERRGKPAGFRTNILICLGATIYMLLSEYIALRMGAINIDHTRIAAQVVTGIGFIGAGTIIQSRGTIIGLTSAAIIWVVAGIGLLIGAGYPLIAIICTLLVLLTLTFLRHVERLVLGKCHFVDCDIVLTDDGGKTKAQVFEIMNEQEVTTTTYHLKHEKNTFRLKTHYCDKHPAHTRFIHEILSVPGVIELIPHEKTH